MQSVQRVGKPCVIVGVRTLFQRCAEGERCFLPFSVFHQRLTQCAPQQRAIAHVFDLLAQHFFQLFRIIGFQTRDRQQQAIVILAFQAVDDNLLGSIMIVTLNKMFRHCHLQGHLMTRFPALVFPPVTQTFTTVIGTRLIHQANPCLLFQHCTMFFITNMGFRH